MTASMRVKCHNCSAGYTLPESKLKPGRRLQFSCRRCGARIVVAIPDSGATEALRSKIGNGARNTGSIGRPSFAPAQRPSSPNNRRVSSSSRKAVEPAVESGGMLDDPTPGHDVGGSRSRTDAIRDMEEERLADSVTDTRSEKSVRWFVANEDGSYKKWQARDLEIAIRGGLISPETLLWRKGMDAWLAADETAEWRQLYEDKGSPESTQPPEDERVAAGRHVSRVSGRVGVEARAAVEAAEAGRRPDPTPSPEEEPSLPVREASDAGVAAIEADDGAPSIVGANREATGQRAVSLPLVRPRADSGARRSQLQRRSRESIGRKPRESGALARNDRAAGNPMDPGGTTEDDASNHWAPATDTYTGPRGSHTHRIGSEGERQALLQHIEREQNLHRQIRTWQWIALGTAAAATLAFVLAFYALLNWQRAAEVAADCDCATAKP